MLFTRRHSSLRGCDHRDQVNLSRQEADGKLIPCRAADSVHHKSFSLRAMIAYHLWYYAFKMRKDSRCALRVTQLLTNDLTTQEHEQKRLATEI